jgi:hypothetical protein
VSSNASKIAFSSAAANDGCFAHIQLSRKLASAHAHDSGANTIIDFGGGQSITLLNVHVAQFNADDFVFF